MHGAIKPKVKRAREMDIAGLLNQLIIASCKANDGEDEGGEGGGVQNEAGEDGKDLAFLFCSWQRKGKRMRERERRAKLMMERGQKVEDAA